MTRNRPTPTLDDGVLVVGQIARDLIVSVDEIPEANRSTDIHRRLEQLGGKGGNQAVGQFYMLHVRKVALHHVRHDIHTSTGRLVRRQGERPLRIENGKLWDMGKGVVAALEHAVFVGNYARIAHLAASGGDGKNGAQRKHRLGLEMPVEPSAHHRHVAVELGV